MWRAFTTIGGSIKRLRLKNEVQNRYYFYEISEVMNDINDGMVK